VADEIKATREARMAAPEKYFAPDIVPLPVQAMDIFIPSISKEKAASTTLTFMHL
jgi:hypothetical protein